jgi:hypothetical protein
MWWVIAQPKQWLLMHAELLRDSHLTVDAPEAAGAKVPLNATVKPAPSRLVPSASVPKRVNGKKIVSPKEPEFKVQRPWGGYHTAAWCLDRTNALMQNFTSESCQW